MQSSGLTFLREECPKQSQELGVTGPTLPNQHKLMDIKATTTLLIYKGQDLLSGPEAR